MRFNGGSANLASALRSALFVALGTMSETSKLVVLLFTSGQFSSPITKPYGELMVLLPTPVMIAVGFGSHLSEQNFAALLPGAKTFLPSSCSNFFTLLGSLKPLDKLPEPPIRISCSQFGTTLQMITNPVSLHVSMEPTSVSGVVPGGTVLHFLPGFYLEEVVKTTADADKEHPFVTIVTLRPGQRALIHKGLVPDKVLYEYFVDGAKYMGYVTLLLAWFGAEWLPERTRLANPTKTRINILAFAAPEHITCRCTEHSLADLLPGNAPTDEMMKRLNLHFWDPWGISESHYTTLSVVDFLNGKVEPGTFMDESFELIAKPGKSRIIHSVIIIIPICTPVNPQALEVMGTQVMSIIRSGRHPIVVCNFINRVSNEFEMEYLFKKICATMYLPEKSVIKFENYAEETTRNMEKDIQYWSILRLAYRNAISYLLAHPQECFLEGTEASVTSNPGYTEQS
ncbi:hypothetical protein Pelo_1885 [Pelomyxa schiedti]|nr:hypothetical protein Pelo_1885 [Pelomyxa schiedti]